MLILIGLFFKLGVVPFHFWVPMVYTYSTSIVTFLFMLLPKISLLYILYKFMALSTVMIIPYYLCILGSLFIGTIFALQSTNIKTFLAYSTIANTSFFLVPIINQTSLSFYALIYYLYAYNILIIIIFTPLLFLIRANKTNLLVNLRDIVMLKKANPMLASYCALAAFGMAGIPPSIGFFSKLFILLSALSFSAYLLIFILLIFSLISTLYYLRIVKITSFSFDLKYTGLERFPLIPALIISIFSLLSIIFYLCPSYWIIIVIA